MSDTAWLKLVEVGGLVTALAVFVWWQWRDLSQARRESAAKRARETPEGTTSAGPCDERTPP